MLVVARAGKFAILRAHEIESKGLQNIFSPATAQRKAEMLAKCEVALHGLEPMRRYHVPGRIEVLGKHTDYAGGHSMVAATEQGFIMTAAPRADRVVQVTNADGRATISFEIHPELQPSSGSWANYPMTVARRIARNFPGELRGAEIALSSDLAPAAGLSSSSALIIAIFLALADANNLWERDEFRRNIRSIEDLAGYLGTNENGQTFGDLVGDRGVGTFGGSQDHTAILGSEAGRLKVYKYCPVKLERTIDLPHGWTFAIASSGVAAEKTGSAMEKYNLASQRVSQIVEIWRDETGRSDATLHDAIQSSQDAPARLRAMLESKDLTDRLDHFLAETVIVPAAALAITNGNARILGALVDQSQKLAEDLLGNQTPETSLLARSARELGAIAASAFGAGFGGSVWALIDESAAKEFLTRWSQLYEVEMPTITGNPAFFTTHPGAAACRIDR